MSNIILTNTLDVAERLVLVLVRKGVTITPRIEIADAGRVEMSFHLSGDAESDQRDILLVSEALDLGLERDTGEFSYWASDVQEIRGVTVSTTIFSEVYRVTPGKATLTAVQ